MADLVDAGADDIGIEASIAKLRASDLAMRMTTEAVQMHGGYGYIRDYRVERLMRDAKITQIWEGTNQVHRQLIGRSFVDEMSEHQDRRRVRRRRHHGRRHRHRRGARRLLPPSATTSPCRRSSARARQTDGFFAKSVERGKMTAADKDAVMGRLSRTTSLDDLAKADLVIEAVFEDLAVKRELLGKLNEICPGAHDLRLQHLDACRSPRSPAAPAATTAWSACTSACRRS